MKVVTLPIGPIAENNYFFYDETTLTGVVIDPGGDAGQLMKFIDENKLSIQYILLTHGHFDHITGVEKLREAISAPVVAHKDEMLVLGGSGLVPDQFIADGDALAFGGHELRVIHTPGHTPGGVCYYAEKEKVVFTGDTLFFESVGRVDLKGGSARALLDAITKKLFILPPDVVVYPGHDRPSTIGHERQYNPEIAELEGLL